MSISAYRRRSGTVARRHSLLLATVAAIALSTSPSFAEEADSMGEGEVVQVPALTIEGEAEKGINTELAPTYAGGQVARGARAGVLGNQDMMDLPFSITAYTEETIRYQQARTVADILANDPSVRMSFGFGNFSEVFVIRGFPLSGEDLSLNGIYGVSPRQITGLEAFERVEVLKGASAFLNGAAPSGGGIGGTINLVSKRAGDEPMTRVTGTYDMDSQLGGHVDSGMRFGNNNEWGIRINVAGRDGEMAIDNEERWYAMGAAALDYRGEKTRIAVDLMTHKTHVENGRPVVNLGAGLTAAPSAPDANTNYAADWSYSTMHDTGVILHAEHDLTSNVMLYGDLGYRTMREDGIYASPTVTNIDGTADVGRLYVPREDENTTAQLGMRSRFVTGGVHHSFNVGFSTLETENRNSYEFGLSAVGATNIYNPMPVPYTGVWFAGGDFNDLPLVSRVQLQSSFISDTLNFFDNRVHLTVGARHQQIHVENFNRTTFAKTSNYDETDVTPVVGLAVNVTDELSVYANRIESLEQGPTAPGTSLNAGEIFAPYTSVQYEVGGKLDLGNVGMTIALFQIDKPIGTDNGVGTLYTVDGEQTNQGIEFSAFGEVSDGWRLLAGATVIDSELSGMVGGINNGNEGVSTPNLQVNLGTEWDLPFLPGATTSARVVYTSSQYTNPANTIEIPSWTRLDLGARYKTEISSHPVMFNLVAENVTNEGYWASAYGGYLTQGRPMTARFSVSTEF